MLEDNYQQIAQDNAYAVYKENREFVNLVRAAAAAGRDARMDEGNFYTGVQDLYRSFSTFLNAVNRDGKPAKHVAWHNQYRLAKLTKSEGEPYINRELIGAATKEYLKGKLRLERYDIALLDVLIAEELFAHIDQSAGRFPFFTQLGLLGIGLSGAALFTAVFSDFELDRLVMAGAAFAALYVVIWAWPQRGPLALHREMKAAYFLLAGSVVSVPELRRRVTKAADQGVVWPPELYALLDDVGARTNVL